MAGSDLLKRERVRQRATRLLNEFFRDDSEKGRRTVFNAAFGDSARDPRETIEWPGPVIEFADQAVGALLKFGCADRGRHSLSVLLEAMASIRGRQTDPDYADLPLLLDPLCALPTRDEELRYLDRLLAEIEEKARLYAPLRGIAEIKPAAAARALLVPWQDDEDIALLSHQPRMPEVPSKQQSQEYDDILMAFGNVKQAALLGAPGAGKSTTLRTLVADLARHAKTDPDAPLPLFVSLGDWRGDEPLDAFLTNKVPEVGWAAMALGKAGRLIVLFDGLNEMPTAKRESKAADVRSFKGRLPATAPFIVSCRRDDYIGALDLQLDTLTLEPLSPQRIRAVLRHWLPDDAEGIDAGSGEQLFWQLAGDQRLADVLRIWLDAGSTEEAFWSASSPAGDPIAYAKTSAEDDRLWHQHVPNPRSLLRLAANPFMLTMLYQVWAFGDGELPRNRGDLFARFVDRLLSREKLLKKDRATGVWQRTPDGERLLSGLTALAWRMQGERLGGGVDEQDNFGVLTVTPREVVLEQIDGEAELKKAEDATLLEGVDEIRFRHQLLQEYFTASALRARIEGIPALGAADLWPADRWWKRSGWEESAVLLAGIHAEDCAPVIRWLRDAQPEVAAQCIQESGANIAEQDALFKELHDTWLPRLTDTAREPEPEARAAIGRALGRLDLDDRKGVGLDANRVPDIDWVEIPGGEFDYQDGARRRIDRFRIARYPVTNIQFKAFVDAEDGYADDRWWEGLDADDTERVSESSRWGMPNHPRETVSWFEAMAFCAWLSDKLGLDIRLPTEWQWERVARGVDGRIYPWGNEYRTAHANIDETVGDTGPHRLGQTTTVGTYPQGGSAEGVLDLSGNVWEWCRNNYDNPRDREVGGEASRPLRGGSWVGSLGYAHAGSRSLARPNDRDGLSGFRVVCDSPIR